MRYEMQLARGLMALALVLSGGGLAAFAPAPHSAVQPAVVCPTPTAPAGATVGPIAGVATMMAPAWRAHLPALMGRRPV